MVLVNDYNELVRRFNIGLHRRRVPRIEVDVRTQEPMDGTLFMYIMNLCLPISV